VGTLTINQLCEELQISRRTVFKWIKEGKINVIRLGARAVRIDESELARIKKEGIR